MRQCATTRRSHVRFPLVSLEFFIDYGPDVDSVSNGKEYQEYFLGGKGGRCLWLTTFPPTCADCLVPSGPVQVCTRIALPSPFTVNLVVRTKGETWGLVIVNRCIYRRPVRKASAGALRDVSFLRTLGESVDQCVGRPMSITLMKI